MTVAVQPLVERESSFLEAEIDAARVCRQEPPGAARSRQEPPILLLAVYSTVIGVVSEIDALRALG
ncbi:MAG: hypothetical protein ACLP62_08580 [Acidimicrobiales bacterium]